MIKYSMYIWMNMLITESMSATGLPSVLHTTWNYRRKSNCFRNRTCKNSEILLLRLYAITHVESVSESVDICSSKLVLLVLTGP